jgi:hypothetical protein
VDHEQPLTEFKRNSHVAATDVFKCIKKYFVSVLVVPEVLFLNSNVDCNLYCLPDIPNSSV